MEKNTKHQGGRKVEKAYVIHAVGIMPNHVHVIAEFDVARAPTPLQGAEVQGRGGLATSGGLTTETEV